MMKVEIWGTWKLNKGNQEGGKFDLRQGTWYDSMTGGNMKTPS